MENVRGIVLATSTQFGSVLKSPFNLDPQQKFNPGETGRYPLAVALVGQFTSFFRDRPIPKPLTGEEDDQQMDLSAMLSPGGEEEEEREPILEESPVTQIIVVGNALFANSSYASQFPGNGIFLLNAIDWATRGGDLIDIRSRAVIDRPLKEVSARGKTMVRFLNNFGISLLVVLFGLYRFYTRRKNRTDAGAPARRLRTMNQKKTWVLLLILAAVVAVLYLMVNPPEREPSEETAEPGLFAGLDLDRISSVVVNTPRNSSTLRRDGDRWVVEEFDDFPADLLALEEAVTALKELELGDVVSENSEKQAIFQVDQSGVEVLLYGDNGDDDLLAHFFLGKPGHDYRSIYFRLADSDQVHLVDQQLRGRFDRGDRTWRNRRPFNFPPEEVSALRLPAGESGEQLSLKLDDQGNWVVEGTEPVPADKRKSGTGGPVLHPVGRR